MTFPNKSTTFFKKRDQKELLISVLYKRTLYQIYINNYGIVSCLSSKKNDYNNKLWNMKELFHSKYNKNQSSSYHTPE